jgi:hypothetical protein
MYADEYWQGTEIAYDLVFPGEVSKPWEWWPEHRIRNYLYPIYLSIPLRILKFLGLDYFYLVRGGYYFA